MYIADLFNSNKLFQTFGGWFKDTKVSFFSQMMKSKTRDLTGIWQQWKDNVQIFEVLLGFATSTILTLNQITDLEQKCIKQFDNLENQMEMKGNRIIFWSHKLVNLLNKISPIINQIRIMQNLLLQLIGKKLGRPLPQYLFILIKNGRQSYDFIPEEIWNKLEKYWEEIGRYIRAYRNLHYYLFSLTTHTYLEVKPAKKLLIVLPDNPEILTTKKFQYQKQMDAIRFLEKAFEKFHDLVEEIADYFGYIPSYILQGWSFIDYQYLPGKEGTVALIIKDPKRGKAIEVIDENGKPLFNKLYMRKNPYSGFEDGW